MGKLSLSADMFGAVADRFKVLAEPARLMILDAMRDGEMTVTELVKRTGIAQANVSKHVRLLHAHGFVRRRKNSQFVHYSAADRSVYRLCDLMCEHLVVEARARHHATKRR